MMISLMPLVISSLIVKSLLLELIQKIASQGIRKAQAPVMTRAATTLVGHSYVGELSRLVNGLMAFDAQKIRRPLHLVIDFPSRPDVPFVIRVTELANLSEMTRLRTANRVTFLAVIHVREVLASARFGLHPVTLEAGRMSLLNGQFILSGIRLFDSLMTIGAAGALAGGKLGRRKFRRPRGDRLEFKALGQRLAMLDVRKIYTKIATKKGMESVGPLFEVEQARGRA